MRHGTDSGERATVLEPERRGEVSDPAPSSELADLAAGLARLTELFEDRLANDRFKEGQITRLHEELQGHRRGLLSRALRPLLIGLIRLHDELGRSRDHLASGPSAELSGDRIDGVLEGFQEDVELLLDQNGVTRSNSLNDRFDPRLQTILRTVPTDDPDRVGRIVRRLRAGFELDGAPLRKEGVEVLVAAEDAPPIVAPGAATLGPNPLHEEELP
jgi:molecular chaperone GrpE (heat shock protein)